MRIIAAVVLMASVSTPALAQASRDTLSEAVDSAISNNPTLMAERKTRGVADEILNQASAQMGPQLSLSGSYGVTNTTVGRQVTTASGSFPDDGNSQRGQVGLEARQSLWSGGALTAQRDQALLAGLQKNGLLKATEPRVDDVLGQVRFDAAGP